MRIGASIFIFYLGMILTSILHVQPAGLNLRATGIILMIVGIGTLIMTCVLWGRGPKSAQAEPPPGEDTDGTTEPRPVYEDPTGPRQAEDELVPARGPVTPASSSPATKARREGTR